MVPVGNSGNSEAIHTVPKRSAQKGFCMGMVVFPFSERALKIRSASFGYNVADGTREALRRLVAAGELGGTSELHQRNARCSKDWRAESSCAIRPEYRPRPGDFEGHHGVDLAAQ